MLDLIFVRPANPTEVKDEVDKYEEVMSALTGSVDDLLRRLPDSALKRSLTGVLAIAKGRALAEAAATRAWTGTGAPAHIPGALAPVAPSASILPGAQSPQLAAGAGTVFTASQAPGVAVPAPVAPNTLVFPGAGGTPQLAAGGSDIGFTVAQGLSAIEKWFDDGMDQVTAWYKRRSQFIIFALGCVLAAWLNLDAIMIATALGRDSALRVALVAEAQEASKAETSPDVKASARFLAAEAKLLNLGLPLGWSDVEKAPNRTPSGAKAWAMKIIGLLATALASSLGAPFWFDLLKRVMMVRAGLNPLEEARQSRSKQKTAT